MPLSRKPAPFDDLMKSRVRCGELQEKPRWAVNKDQINVELSRLIALQTEFYQKANPTPAELQEFERAGRRIRELFAQLAQLTKAA